MAAATSICRELRLRDYRNFTELELQFPAAGAAIIGENGAGKTNLLEALYYLEIFRSFRGAPDEQLVRFDAPAFHLRGRFEDTGSGRTGVGTAAYEVKERRMPGFVNCVETERLSEAIGNDSASIYTPSDDSVVDDAPGERRRYHDIVR